MGKTVIIILAMIIILLFNVKFTSSYKQVDMLKYKVEEGVINPKYCGHTKVSRYISEYTISIECKDNRTYYHEVGHVVFAEIYRFEASNTSSELFAELFSHRMLGYSYKESFEKAKHYVDNVCIECEPYTERDHTIAKKALELAFIAHSIEEWKTLYSYD